MTCLWAPPAPLLVRVFTADVVVLGALLMPLTVSPVSAGSACRGVSVWCLESHWI